MWISGPQEVSVTTEEQATGLGKFALGVGGAALLGKYTGFDRLASAIRYVEEYSPAHIFRTFQLSHILSPLETASQQYRFVPPETISHLMGSTTGRAWLEHLSRVAGQDVYLTDIAEKGFRFQDGRILIGETGEDVLVRHAGIMRTVTPSMPNWEMSYARSLKGSPIADLPPGIGPRGAEIEENFAKRVFSQKITARDIADNPLEEIFTVTGGQTRKQAVWRSLAGDFTASVERLNQLARAPFEMEPFATFLKKVPGLRNLRFGVTPSSGLKTFAKLTGKLGIMGTASYLGYQEIDHMMRNSDLLDSTIFSEGLSAAIGTGITSANLGASKLADSLGLHEYRESQEEIAPGSTKLSRLLAYPLMGALGGIGISFAQKIARQVGYQRGGMNLGEASMAASLRSNFFVKQIYGKAVDPNLLAYVSKPTQNLIRQEAIQLADTKWGTAAKWIAERQGKGTVRSMALSALGDIGPAKLKMLAGAGIGLGLILPFLPGALIPSERPEQLEAWYSGREEVAVRKGQHWEFSRSPWEGSQISRYEKHWYPSLLARAKEKSLWGENAPAPLTQWWIANTSYKLEEKHYRDRPYPISGVFGEEIPFIGPLVAATIGKLIKPSLRMHESEWIKQTSGGEEYLREPLKYGEREEISELGDKPPGAPIDPYGFKGTVGDSLYRFTEIPGLKGFALTSLKEKITGKADFFSQEQQIESSGRIYSFERGWWDTERGGMLGTNELLRRLYPHRRRDIPLYNPIPNAFADVDWLPGEGEKSENFKVGDIFSRIPMGESRLPGVGFSALNPELEGVDPHDYPAVWRHRILADVAPFSEKFQTSLADVRSEIAAGNLSERELEVYQETQRQLKEKRQRKSFSEYKYRNTEQTEWKSILEDAESQTGTSGRPSSFLGSLWEKLTHNTETPLEFLTPVSPGAKLVHQRSAVEDYGRTQVWGHGNAFWQNPIRDFLMPTITSAAHMLGSDSIPGSVKTRRDIEEQFDILEYIKQTKLAREYSETGEEDLAREAEKKRRQTLFGLNPYTYNFSDIYRSLPRRDRDYFKSFSQTRSTEDRSEILGMVPENEKALYIAKWKAADVSDMREAIRRGLLSEKQVQEAESEIQEHYEESKTHGFTKTAELWEQYIQTRLQGESYPDWYRRVILIPERLKTLPGPDWVAFTPYVELSDVKMKIVENMGDSLFDYDIWQEQAREGARKPYLDEAARELEEEMSPQEIRDRLSAVLGNYNVSDIHIDMEPIQGKTSIDLRLEEERDIRRVR